MEKQSKYILHVQTCFSERQLLHRVGVIWTYPLQNEFKEGQQLTTGADPLAVQSLVSLNGSNAALLKGPGVVEGLLSNSALQSGEHTSRKFPLGCAARLQSYHQSLQEQRGRLES